MKFTVIVPGTIEGVEEPVEPQSETDKTAFRAAAVEAIKNAIRQRSDNGFDHALNESTAIEISAVELMGEG